MTVLLIILAVLLLIGLIPIGAAASYKGSGFSAYARIGAYKISLFPKKEKKKGKEKTEKKPKEEAEKKPKEKSKSGLDFSKNEWLEVVKIALKAAGKVKKGITVDNFELKYISASDDPFDAVERYNTVNAIVYSLLPYFENAFKIKKRNIVIDTDLNSEKSIIEGEIALSLRIGQSIFIAITTASAFLKVYHNHKKERKQENGKQQTQRNDAVNNGKHKEPC